MANLAAVVLCAGKGTRMKSEKAKVLHPLLGRPLFAYPLARALELGAHPVVAVVGHQAKQVIDAIQGELAGRPLRFAHQTEQLGTGHAVRSAANELKDYRGPVLILVGDAPLIRKETLEALIAAHRQAKGPLSLVTMFPADPSPYGRIVRKGDAVKAVVENKDCTPTQRKIRECNAGIYVVESAFLWPALGQLKPSNAQGEFYLTDLVALAAKKGKLGVVTADSEEVAGVNDRAELAQRAKVLQARINDRLMKSGVTLVQPETAFIGEEVEIGADSEIGPMVSLFRCRIGKDVRIGQGCVLSQATVGAGTNIKPYSVIEDAQVGERCEIGPFARLRPGTELAEAVHIGNFVETKKTRVGKGSKANHLTYLGDAEVGAGVNVGAGTITCNYDGVNKHRTVIEDEVFIGSDTQIVAPRTIGKGAYVGAGTTVTQDVPPMSLALSRSPQVNKEGWVAKKKAGLKSVKASHS